MRCTPFPLLILAVLAAALAAGCAPRRAAPVTLKGSDTMVLLGQRWAEAYMASHPGAVVQVTGGGSGTGIAALINGTTDVCQASRSIKPAENEQLARRHGEAAQELVVARDGLAIYVNASSPVAELTLEQIRDVYLGRITNWKPLGGPDAPIVPYSRENSSGTYAYFKEHVLAGQDFSAAIQPLPGTAAVVNAVARDPNAIGYGGAAYAKGVKEVAVKRDAASPAVLPTLESVTDGSYPIARPLYWYTRKAPAGAVKAFADWVLGEEGQRLVTEVGYFPAR